MDAPARRSGETLLEALYRVVMRRTPVYVTFVVVGAFLAEQTQKGLSGGEFILITACMPIIELLEDTRSHKLLAIYAKRFEDIPVLGTRQLEE